ncbi:hypothetical protein AB4876_17085 [Zhongshania guokunii]|uniref:Uncharacterized protein n=1 Tax=Zhongshania guokunii TaxID=641783 RepID=A0ABV3U9W0_9GAMM
MKATLLLTSTLHPPERGGDLARQDLVMREQDYRESLRKWMHSGFFDRIVYCDNSGLSIEEIMRCLDFDSLSRMYDKVSVEFLSLKDTPDTSYHYGHSELGLIDYAFRCSTFISDSDYFVKSTGRLFFSDFGSLRKVLDSELKFHVDCRCNFLWFKEHVTTQFMIFNTRFFESNLLGAREGMRPDEFYIEIFLLRFLRQYEAMPGSYFRWPMELLPDGVAAHSGKRYDSLNRSLISYFRGLFRKYCPNLWI